MNVLILQPPIVQLNTVYPSGAYLSSFFKQLGCNTKWIDLNIQLFYELFSRDGLTKLFQLCENNALTLAEQASRSGDEATSFNLRRYIAQKDLWINWIDFITSTLHNDTKFSGYENAHRFCFGAHVPRGNRMERYLENLDHNLSTDDARSLASYALADLADFITIAFDNNFSLVRYAERLTISEATFSNIAGGADSPVLKHFYEPLLKRLFESELKDFSPSLVCISIPFAGTFAAALSTGRFIKNFYKNGVPVSFGGGFVNTELRSSDEPLLAEYCDFLSFDRGYASYKKIFEFLTEKRPLDSARGDTINNRNNVISTNGSTSNSTVISTNSYTSDSTVISTGAGGVVEKSIFKLKQFIKKADNSVQIIQPAPDDEASLQYERQITSSLIPDFSDIDFSLYPRLIDDVNPMHRLWSDGAWIKVYMAHGCYWHKCAFCDVTLDYVCGYCPTNIHNLYEGIYSQCKSKGIWGIHFVDEAMPPAMMIEFARENIAHGSPITWWGNVRFEKFFTRDVADYLSYGGLIGVSAGLESATGNGLNAIHKGTDLESIVGACCAFKEAGILVHAYMIYGYWWEQPQDLINSMETLRQFYANGLLDSCFWHKFVLTRHSRVYKEWSEGLIKDLVPVENNSRALFAKNGLNFKGEEKSEKYGPALDYSLNQWMHGQDLNMKIEKWFDFPVPKPDIPKDFIDSLIARYEEKRDEAFTRPLPAETDKIVWLGGEKVPCGKNKIGWNYMGEFHTERKDAPLSAFRGRGLVVLP